MRKLTIVLILMSVELFAQNNTFTNPILHGGYADPSICRVGDDYYIVNSSFEYFPGLPIHHSRDLVNWEMVGYGLHRKEQVTKDVNLVDVQSNGGIHAPTLRHHDGLFYLITTNIYSPMDKEQPTEFVNFIITAENIAGPWSEPHVIAGAPGIDPDLFFDDNRKVYFVGTHAVGNPDENGIGEIWVQELELNTWTLIGDRFSVWRGACGGCCVEGPHMYKVNGTYYLMIAEGGTSHNHAVMIAASDNVAGPFESNPRNPILTSRHLSLNNWVHSTGHADLVELKDGRWYMVALGIRNNQDGASNMGRETHLMPVIWESITVRWQQVSTDRWEPVKFDFPVVAPETGKVERLTPLPFKNQPQYYNDVFTDNFETQELHHEWNFRRVPRQGTYSTSARDGFLRLYAKPDTIMERGRCSLLGIRQKESDFEFSTRMIFSSTTDALEAGVSLFQKDDNFINFTLVRRDSDILLQVAIAEPEKGVETRKQEVLKDYAGEIIFRVVSKNQLYSFEYSLDQGENFIHFTETNSNHILSRGYTGAYLGIYCTSHGKTSSDYADFDWVYYIGYPRF
jgi:xylan 1,4-beta-xylosidase